MNIFCQLEVLIDSRKIATAQKILNQNRKLTAKMEAPNYVYENFTFNQTTRAKNFAIIYFVAKFLAQLLE